MAMLKMLKMLKTLEVAAIGATEATCSPGTIPVAKPRDGGDRCSPVTGRQSDRSASPAWVESGCDAVAVG